MTSTVTLRIFKHVQGFTRKTQRQKVRRHSFGWYFSSRDNFYLASRLRLFREIKSFAFKIRFKKFSLLNQRIWKIPCFLWNLYNINGVPLTYSLIESVTSLRPSWSVGRLVCDCYNFLRGREVPIKSELLLTYINDSSLTR